MQGVDNNKLVMRGSPVTLAAVFASQLESDPVMAAKVKEHLPPKRLLQLLDIRIGGEYRAPLVCYTDGELRAEITRREVERAQQRQQQPVLPLESTQNDSSR